MKRLLVVAILCLLPACDKPTDSSSSIVGTWDYSADAYKNGTITVTADAPLAGYLYYHGNRYDFTGTYDIVGASMTILTYGTKFMTATVSKDKKNLSGTIYDGGQYPFTASKR